MRIGIRLLMLGLCGLLAAACTKCGDPLKFNAPSLPKSCSGDTNGG